MTLDEEKMSYIRQIAALDQEKQHLPEADQLEDLRQILAKQEAYLRTLGFFHRRDKLRVEEQIRLKKEEISQLEIRLENRQRELEDMILFLEQAKACIEEEQGRKEQ